MEKSDSMTNGTADNGGALTGEASSSAAELPPVGETASGNAMPSMAEKDATILVPTSDTVPAEAPAAVSNAPVSTPLTAIFYFGLITESENPDVQGYMASVNQVTQKLVATDESISSSIQFQQPTMKNIRPDGKVLPEVNFSRKGSQHPSFSRL